MNWFVAILVMGSLIILAIALRDTTFIRSIVGFVFYRWFSVLMVLLLMGYILVRK